uniref:DUF2589 domain-containing protein n=1 Tax=Candidatus Methanogaster sp. ANME-2c ERB4 TaxID=2759911 RepID=A0A7G9YLT1_9EURY|nr:hypothetical protein OEPDFBKK_00041 [Methanosarcinales archaeon ANME-2c ERB4]
MVNPGQELSSIDFESMLGGPLIAVVNAQAQAAISSVNFIKSVGFKEGASDDPESSDTGEPIYVTFKYPKEVSPYQPAVEEVRNEANEIITPASAEVAAQFQEMKLEVPILTMLPIPFIRIEETTVDFNAKITSMQYRKVDTKFKIDASLEAKAGWFFGSAKLKVSTSYQRNTTQGSNVKRAYSMAVHIKAVQDEMPAGMEKVLGILEDAMRSQPVSAPAPVPA